MHRRNSIPSLLVAPPPFSCVFLYVTCLLFIQGVNEECPAGQMCFAEIECPLPPTISPAPTRSPVKGYAIGKHDKQIIGASVKR